MSHKRTSTIHDLCPDVWEQIFVYFEVMQLFTTFTYVTSAVNHVLFNQNKYFFLRGLTLDADVKVIPKEIPLNRIISLTMKETSYFQRIELCSVLRSLKLVGEANWIIFITNKIALTNTNLEQLTVDTPKISSLSELLTPIVTLCSLRRLEISIGEFSDSREICPPFTISSTIEQFILHSSSIIDWNDLSHMLSSFTSVRFMNVSSVDFKQKTMPSFTFHNLRILSLGLLEVSFEWIIQLVATMPDLVKLKLSGLVDDDDFVINQRWTQLLGRAPSLSRICVDLFMQRDRLLYYCEQTRTSLRALNLNLKCDNNDDDDHVYYGTVDRWWSLKGIVTSN